MLDVRAFEIALNKRPQKCGIGLVIKNFNFQFGADILVRGSLEIHLAQTSADWEIAHAMLDEEHFLGARLTSVMTACGRKTDTGSEGSMLRRISS